MAFTFIALFYAIALILLANAAAERGFSHRYLRLLQAAMPAVIALQLLNKLRYMWLAGAAHPTHWLLWALAGAACALMLLLLSFESAWSPVERLIRATSLGAAPIFDSRRPMHRLALLFMLCAFASLMLQAGADGALQALLATLTSSEGALLHLATNAAAAILLAFLGVGWLARRDWTGACARLGLRLPTGRDILAGIGLGCALYLGVALLTLLWQSAVSASAFEWQTAAARQIFDVYSRSLLLGALLALLSALGEEILFRGALQPVFGVLIVSLFFTASHLQYALTPAAGIVFVASLAFGLARAWLSSTAAILAHFVYNILPFLLTSLS